MHDPESPWLAFHATCLQEVVPERIVAIYDEVATDEQLLYSQRERLIKELRRLEKEVEDVRRILERPPPRDLPGLMRPGIRYEPPNRRR